MSLLYNACLNGKIDDVKQQLDQEAPIDEKGSNGLTALHAASSQGHKPIVELLIKHGANINARADDGQTPLHKAIVSNQAAIVQLLLQQGADITAIDGSNLSKTAEIKAAFNQATSLQNKNLKSVPTSALNQNAQFTLRLGNNKFGPDVWDTLTSSSACTQFLVGLFLQSNPSLGTIPDSVAKLGQLSYLSVVACGLSISSIRALTLLPNLRSLDLSENILDDLPTEFSRLKKLRILNASKCNLSIIPVVVFQLTQLRHLNLNGNPIHRIPVALTSLPNLTNVTLADCPLTAIPSEFRNISTTKLLQFLNNLSQQSEPVYRSNLVPVGYEGVGKTTLLSALFPISAILLKKSGSLMKSVMSDPWEQRRCKIEGTKFVYERPTKSGGWEKPEEMDLVGATIEADKTDQVTWLIQLKNQKHEFRCQAGLEREEWVNACKFQAKSVVSDGIYVTLREITHTELQSAFDKSHVSSPNPALPNWERTNRVPKDKALRLTLWDFAGQYEYQDGHQLFFTSRSVYLVLWDVTPTKRPAELAKLRHWLVTLQLQLGSNQLRNSVLIYIIGTHADAPDVDLDQCDKQATRAIEALQFSLPYRLIAGIDLRNRQHVSSLKQQLLADLAVQAHLGEEVPASYLDLEQHLHVAQKRYRLQYAQQHNLSSLPIPMLQISQLASQRNLDINLAKRGLSLLHLWGQIIYLGDVISRSKLDEVVVYLPEWLIVSALGSLVTELRKQRSRADSAASSGDKDESFPFVCHADIIRLSPVWKSLSSEQREQTMEILYAFDICFPEHTAEEKPFEDRSSLFPLLLPLKPPRSFKWASTSKSENVRVVELNGIPMGFYAVLSSRLRYFGRLDASSCWQTGFIFTEDQQCILVTIHEDSNRLRFCVRNSPNAAKVFSDLLGILRQILSDRYNGLRIVNEFVECSCEGCRLDVHKWQWNRSIAETIEADASIRILLRDTASRSELSSAILQKIQPEGAPFYFNLIDIANLASKRTPSGLCAKYKNTVPLANLLSSVDIEKPGHDVFISYRENVSSDLASYIKDKLVEKKFKVFYPKHDEAQVQDVIVQSLKSSACVLLVLKSGSLDPCLDGRDSSNSDWVHREIAVAIANKILIIPIMASFEWPTKDRLPEDIRVLPSYNGVEWNKSYTDAAIDKIADLITKQLAM